MIREVDLATYLPEFMQAYKEPVAALEAESPEFNIVWSATNRVLYNRFIATADEYGISRFEKIMGLYPESTDTLEIRRTRIMARWFTTTPYTIRMLISRVSTVLNYDQKFFVALVKDAYELILAVSSTEDIPVDELKYILSEMVPVNMLYKIVWFLIYTIEFKEQFRLQRIWLKYRLPYWNTRYLDGIWLLDGERLLNSNRCRAKVALNVCLKVDMSDQETVANVAVVTKTRDCWFLDGDKLLDGTRKLNSLYKKEAVD